MSVSFQQRGNDCLKLQNISNGRAFKYTINPSTTSYRTVDIEIQVKNACNSRVYADNFHVELQGIKVNHGINMAFSHISFTPKWFPNGSQPLSPGAPNGNQSFTISPEGNLRFYIQSQGRENWALTKPGEVINMSVKLGTSESVIEKVEVSNVVTSSEPNGIPTSEVTYRYNDIPSGIGVIVEIYEENDSKVLVTTKTLKSTSNSFVHKGVPVGTKVTFKAKGVINPTIRLNKIEKEITISSTRPQSVTVTADKKVETKVVRVKYNGCDFNDRDKPIGFLFTSNDFTYSYLYVSEYKGNYYFRAPLDEISYSFTSVVGWNISVSPAQTIGAYTTNLSITCQVNDKKSIALYYESWSALYYSELEKNSLANLPDYVDFILLAFASPSCSYDLDLKVSDINTTGMEIRHSINEMKQLVKIAKTRNPNIKFILSVGGWGYNDRWIQGVNIQCLVDLIIDLDIDGIDIDHEVDANCTGHAEYHGDKDNLKCESDNQLIQMIDDLHEELPKHALITIAPTSTAAWGTTEYPRMEYPLDGRNTGRWVEVFRQREELIDIAFLMTYDSGTLFTNHIYNCYEAFASLFGGKILFGGEVPLEVWPKTTQPDGNENHILTEKELRDISKYCLNKPQCLGYFLWSMQKNKDANYKPEDYVRPACEEFGLANCNLEFSVIDKKK